MAAAISLNRISSARKGRRQLGESTGRRRALAAATAVALTGLIGNRAIATTQNSTWTDGGATNLWNTAGNWSPSGVPNNGTNGFSDYNVSIGTPAPCVLGNGFSPTIDNLTMTAGGVLDIQYASTLTMNGPSLTDNGLIVVNSNQGGQYAAVQFGANTTISGTGSIVLEQSPSNAQLAAASGITVTQAAGHSIGGYGGLALGFVNNGTVNSNYSGGNLQLGTYNMSNNLTFEATNGGTLTVSGIQVTQGTSGVILAATNSGVTLSNAVVTGGTLNSTGTGAITINGTSTVTNVTNSGTIDIPYNNTLNATGSLVDNGLIFVNSNQQGELANLAFGANTSITGSGAIILEQSTTDAELTAAAGIIVTQAATHTIAGYGGINVGLVNNGTVNANVSGGNLQLGTFNMSNNLTFEATNGGTLTISGIQVTQGTSGVIFAASGSGVTLANTIVSGGTLNSTGSGAITISGTSTIASVTNNGTINIPYANTLNITGNLVDNGSILVNSNEGGEIAILNFSGGTVSGTGSISLLQYQNNAQLNGSLTQAAGHTIQGYGQINATLTNNGVVDANISGGTLYIESPTVRNSNLMEATGGGGLYFDSEVAVNNSGGTISAAGGTVTLANGTAINAGTLRSTAPNVIVLNNYNSSAGYSASVNNITIAASSELDIPYPNALAVTGTTLTNNGLILVNSNAGGEFAQILFNSNILLTGAGTIQLQEPGSNALIATAAGVTVIQDIHHSITGYGEISASLINNNIVNTDVSGQTLYLDTYNKTNNLTFEATNGANLQINGITVTQGVNGTITAGAGSVVALSAANITNGTLSSSGTGYFTLNNNVAPTSVFNSVINNAAIDLPYYYQLNVNGNLINNGTILVNSDEGGAVAELYFSGGTVSGTGSINLEQGGNNAQIDGFFNQSAGHTISGYGQINATMTNNGLITANVSGQTFTLAGLITNNNLIEAVTGGNLLIIGTTITQSATSQIYAGAGTNNFLYNANIAGGSITGPGSFNVTAGYTAAFTGGVTISSTLYVPYYSQVNVTGGLINNGTIVLNNDTGGAVAELNISGGTLSGTGTVYLEQGGNNAQVDGVFTMAAGQTIAGYGQINALLTNNGIINANVSGQAITLGAAITNNSLIEASVSGAGLIVNGVTVTQSAAGQIILVNGSNMAIANANITGGSIVGPGTATLSGTVNLTNLSNSAVVLVPYYYQLNLNGTITDNGQIIVNSDQAGATAEVLFSGGTINGTGAITLQFPGSNAQIDGPFTQGAGHTIQGYGDVYSNFNNSGTVDANVNGQSLYLLGNASNNGLFQASNGGILDITSGVLTNLVGTTLTGGSYEVDANSTILLTGNIVTNAATITLGGGSYSFGALTPLATNSGTFNLKSGAIFSTVGNLFNSGAISNAGSLTISGSFNQTAGSTVDSGSLAVIGSTNISGGIVNVAVGGTFVASPITVGPGAELLANGSLASIVAITDTGTVIFGVNPYPGILKRTLNVLSIGSGGYAAVASSNASSNRSLLYIATFNIAGTTNAWTGKLDLGDNDLDLPNASLATITNQIKQGYSNGTFQGSGGITSSAAITSTTHLTTLGVIQNNQSGTALYSSASGKLFDGTTPGAGDILVKYTYYGDANLDGKVDGSDYTRIDNGFTNHLTGWYNGDFNYDGVINGSDYALIDNSFNTQGSQISAEIGSPTVSIASEIAGGTGSAVPEPASMGLLLIGAAGMLGRRRQR